MRRLCPSAFFMLLLVACRQEVGRAAPIDAPIRESWVAPARTPRHCDSYRTADPKYWSAEERASAEKDCWVEEELRAYVTERQHCSCDADCVVIPADCPFGCMGIPVNASEAAAVVRKQADLRGRLDSDCTYKCRSVTRTVCEKGWCLAAW
jgi:hypothetical protein